jgi:biotin operon repressor
MSDKLTKEEVLESLQDKEWHTTAELASEKEVSNPTIGNRIKELAKDGFGILAGRKGYKLVEIGDVTDEEAAREIERMTQRMIEIVGRQALVAKMMRRLAGEAKKLLPKTPEERQIVRKYLVQLTHLIDFQEIDEE